MSKIISMGLVLCLANWGVALGNFRYKPKNKTKAATPSQAISSENQDFFYIRARTLFINDNLEEAYAAISEQLQFYPGDKKSHTLHSMIKTAIERKANGEHKNARMQMLNDVDKAWKIEESTDKIDNSTSNNSTSANSTVTKLVEIIIPQAHFINIPISQAVEMITELSIKYDTTTENPYEKGVNIVLLCPSIENEPRITLNLRNISLERLLFYVSQAANYKCDHTYDAVIIGDEKLLHEQLETKFFPFRGQRSYA